MSRSVTAEDLEYGLGVLARIIDTQGDAVWPLFERLERELEDVRSRRGRVERHLCMKSNGGELLPLSGETDIRKSVFR